MSDLGEARILRLERLESRSLLAAGVLDFALATGDFDSEQKPALNVQANPVIESRC